MLDMPFEGNHLLTFTRRRRGQWREAQLDRWHGPGLCSGLPAIRGTNFQHSTQHPHKSRFQGEN